MSIMRCRISLRFAKCTRNHALKEYVAKKYREEEMEAYKVVPSEMPCRTRIDASEWSPTGLSTSLTPLSFQQPVS